MFITTKYDAFKSKVMGGHTKKYMLKRKTSSCAKSTHNQWVFGIPIK